MLKKDWVWENGSDADAPEPPPTTSEDIGEAGWKAFEALKIEWYSQSGSLGYPDPQVLHGEDGAPGYQRTYEGSILGERWGGDQEGANGVQGCLVWNKWISHGEQGDHGWLGEGRYRG